METPNEPFSELHKQMISMRQFKFNFCTFRCPMHVCSRLRDNIAEAVRGECPVMTANQMTRIVMVVILKLILSSVLTADLHSPALRTWGKQAFWGRLVRL